MDTLSRPDGAPEFAPDITSGGEPQVLEPITGRIDRADPNDPSVTRRAWLVILALAVVSTIAVTVVAITVPNRSDDDRAVVRAAGANAGTPMPADDAAGSEVNADAATATGSTTTAAGVLPAAPPPPAAPVQTPNGRIAPVVSRVPTTDKVIFLGIDDGLVRDPAVLEYLRTNRIPFTAFLTKPFAEADEGFWRQAVAAGGVIEGHTATHPDLRKLNWNQLNNEICKVADSLGQRFGARPTLFRPPYGLYDDRVRATAASCGMKAIVMWKGATNDGRLDLAENVLKPGDVLLLHWRADLLENLKVVVAKCQEQGFTIGRLQSYLG